MIYRGIARGNIIELEESLPYPEGQPLNVSVEPPATNLHSGSPAAIRRAMCEPPHLDEDDVDELEQAIEEGKLPVQQESVFDTGERE
jgi:anti-sigma28 factor (negative regulator of flagellin synthesis)